MEVTTSSQEIVAHDPSIKQHIVIFTLRFLTKQTTYTVLSFIGAVWWILFRLQ